MRDDGALPDDADSFLLDLLDASVDSRGRVAVAQGPGGELLHYHDLLRIVAAGRGDAVLVPEERLQ